MLCYSTADVKTAFGMPSGGLVDRVAVYIDGFNLYFGLCDRGWRRYPWLDLPAFAARLLSPGQTLVVVKYFTARVRGDPGKIERQSAYLQALEARGGLTVLYGRYQERTKQCHSCRRLWTEYEEKMSDVRLAVELLRDAYSGLYDTALIVSADGDLEPPIEAVRQEHPEKRVVVAFPPRRDSYHLRSVAHAHYRIGRRPFSESQLPATVAKSDGFVLKRPVEWH
jgi:uncharacterized LabA/DUF88 family protein